MVHGGRGTNATRNTCATAVQLRDVLGYSASRSWVVADYRGSGSGLAAAAATAGAPSSS
jgi:hypothetical protein